MHLNMSAAKWRPFCPGGDELIGQMGPLSRRCYKRGGFSGVGVVNSFPYSITRCRLIVCHLETIIPRTIAITPFMNLCNMLMLYKPMFILSPAVLIHKSHNAPGLYPAMQHSDQACANFCSELWMIICSEGAVWDKKQVQFGICGIGLWLHHD